MLSKGRMKNEEVSLFAGCGVQKRRQEKTHSTKHFISSAGKVLFTLPQLLLTTVPKGQAAIYTSALLPGHLFLLGYLKST